MADQLAAPSELASLLQRDLDAATANVVLNASTAVVQEAADGQRLVRLTAQTYELDGTIESVLLLPQRPVTAVTSVTLDGIAITDWRLMGKGTKSSRLWRADGWQTALYEPSTVGIVCDHGYVTGVQDLELAKAATLSLGRGVYDNPGGVTSEAIDDYRVAYERAAAVMAASPHLRAALGRQYGRPAGFVRIGGS